MKKEQNGCEIIPMAKDYKFHLSQLVNLRISDEWGEVQARAQYLNGENQYLVHYQAADKCATERWYSESQLVAVEDDRSPGMPVFGSVDLPEGEKVLG
ncbi:hypothetical protein [Atlantibacter hermannii]|uniref:hypothetical protein n=1 Tax=Atlantibacter hermannii TaxID=565 RepID=UPI00289FEFA4|nr:hypothetical protein [Atlantibacter hermannii]